MTFAQISYFLEVANCLSFTEAAGHLYMTQPTLSRQITAIESELNMQLFIRDRKHLRLTPGGQILRSELERMMEDYQQILEKARCASWGMTGELRIGVLAGHGVSDILPGAVEYMEEHFPNIKLYLQRGTYSMLLKNLYEKRLDAVISYGFHLENKEGIRTRPLQETRPILAIPKRKPLAQKEQIHLRDLAQESIVIVKTQECEEGVQLVTEAFRQYGGFYPDYYFVESMEDAILWVEAGVKCALINTGMNIYSSNAIRTSEVTELPSLYVELGWYEHNDNHALEPLLEYFNHHTNLE